jgi:hypothetical protein
MRSEDKILAAIIIALTLIGVLVIISIIAATVLTYVFIALAALIFLTVTGIGIRKWQHSGLPVHESNREYRRLSIEEENAKQQRQLARERQEAELALWQQHFQLQQHLALTRAGYDDNGNPPILLHQPDTHVMLLPAGMPPYRPTKEQVQQAALPPVEEAKQLPPPVDVYTLLSTGRWLPHKGMLFLAISTAGLVQIALDLAWHIALAGSTGGGKTNQLRLLLPQMVRWYTVYYISPAFAPIKSNHEDWRPIQARLAGTVARLSHEIEFRLQWTVEELRRRQDAEYNGDISWKNNPIYIVIDEFKEVCKRYPGAADDVCDLLRQARQYKIFVILAAQDFLIKNIGGDSGARDCYRTALYYGGDPNTARALLDVSSPFPFNEQDLGTEGRLVLRTKTTETSEARAPFMSNRAIYELLGWPNDPILDDVPVSFAHNPTAWGLSQNGGDTEMEPFPSHPAVPGDFGKTSCLWEGRDGPSTGDLENTVEADSEPSGTQSQQSPSVQKRFSQEQEVKFIRLYRHHGNIKDCLRVMRLGNAYGAHAKEIVEQRKLRRTNA